MNLEHVERMIHERLDALVPGPLGADLLGAAERFLSDVSVTLTELLAWVGDVLSRHQDGIANEGYLETARRRRSATRFMVLVLSVAVPMALLILWRSHRRSQRSNPTRTDSLHPENWSEPRLRESNRSSLTS